MNDKPNWFDYIVMRNTAIVLGIILALFVVREWWNYECDALCEAKRDAHSWRTGQ
jgi:hypothetical protein